MFRHVHPAKTQNSLHIHTVWLSVFAVHLKKKYHSNQMAFANSVDLDQTLQNVVSDQGLHCLPYIYNNILDTSTGSQMDYFKFRSMVGR